MYFKKIIKIKVICFIFLFQCLLLAEQSFAYDRNGKVFEIVNAQGVINNNLLQLLDITKVQHKGTLQSIVESTQKDWLRQPGIERWEIVEQDRNDDKDKIMQLLQSLGCVQAIQPIYKSYDYVLWMGALYDRMESRLQHLINLWQSGLRFNQLIILTGARPLIDSEKLSCAQKYGSAVLLTEADCMKFIYEKIAMPEEMRKIPAVFINVSMLKNIDGSLRRPTTADTVNLWLEQNPQYGFCLVISNQPYVQYQHSVVRSLLPEKFYVETVGEKSQETNIDDYLDNLARILYQEKKRLKL